MALLTGRTEDGQEVPVQVKPDGRLVAEGLMGPTGGVGPAGPVGPVGPVGPIGPPGIYEEQTWVPRNPDGTPISGMSGKYLRIGNLVVAHARVYGSGGWPGKAPSISQLPFNPDGGTGTWYCMSTSTPVAAAGVCSITDDSIANGALAGRGAGRAYMEGFPSSVVGYTQIVMTAIYLVPAASYRMLPPP